MAPRNVKPKDVKTSELSNSTHDVIKFGLSDHNNNSDEQVNESISNVYPPPNVTAAKKRPSVAKHAETAAKKIKVDYLHAHHETGTVLTLGTGDTGQLGLGEDITERRNPAVVGALPANVVQVCAGGMHSVCLTADGKVWTFGCNDEFALGRDTSEDGSETKPAEVNLPACIIQVSAGDSHTTAVDVDGKLYVWGTFRDSNGVIGLTAPDEKAATPKHIPFKDPVVKVASGSDHIVVLTDQGTVFTFGVAEHGQLGRVGEMFSSRGGRRGLSLLLVPQEVRIGNKVIFDDIWAGFHITYARCARTGQMYSWGLNNYYQLAVGDSVNRFVPCLAKFLSSKGKWKSISIGDHHVLASNDLGHVYSMGNSVYGRLGLGNAIRKDTVATPTQVETLTECIQVACGSACSFATTSSGVIYSWGRGDSLQLGVGGDEDDCYEPTLTKGQNLQNKFGLMVSAGGQHTLLLVKDKPASAHSTEK